MSFSGPPPSQFWPVRRTNSSFQAHIAPPPRANRHRRNSLPPIHDDDLTSQSDEMKESFPRVRSILGTLCDLQAITGLGLVVAGLAQWRTITFYHEQLVLSYYFMTLNSFWAARVNYMSWDYADSAGGIVRLLIRRPVIIASSTGGLVLQVYVFWREERSEQWVDWSPPGHRWHRSTDGRCYRFLDRSNPLFSLAFWGSGQLIFTLALCLSLSQYTRRISERIFKAINWVTKHLRDWLKGSWKLCCQPWQGPSCAAILVVTCQRVGGALLLVGASFLFALWFLAQQLLDVWSYGDAFYPLSWLVYFLLLIYNIWGVASLIQVNRAMVQGNELGSWGFGQVLPIALLLSIVYATMDAVSGKTFSCNTGDNS